MPLYFFHLWDDGRKLRDDIGADCRTIQDVQDEATMSLAELACDRAQGLSCQKLEIEVQDAGGEAVMRTSLVLEARMSPGLS